MSSIAVTRDATGAPLPEFPLPGDLCDVQAAQSSASPGSGCSAATPRPCFLPLEGPMATPLAAAGGPVGVGTSRRTAIE